jgi:tetratricopeptide (TPR) repeat protein
MILRRTLFGLAICLMLCVSHGIPAESWAGDADRAWVSRVISVQGHVLVKRQGANEWKPVALDDPLFAGDQIRVGDNSRAGIVLSNDAVLRLDQNTTLMFTEIERPATFIFKLLKGAANFFSHRPRSLKIVTPFVNGVVEGTEFFVQVDARQTRIDLFEGRILAQNTYGELLLSKGQGAVARAGHAPQVRILAHPRDSVQWALYYPPVLAVGAEGRRGGFAEPLAVYNQGRPVEAIQRLDTTAQKDRNSDFYAMRAGLLLNVGRVDQAREDIRKALALDAANGNALALQAVIAVVQNRKAEALATAQMAVKNNPRSAAAHIALSYAHQAVFKLPEARLDARNAVTQAPESGIAWARQAELQLSTGELDLGVQSAEKASALNPRIAHAHTILGFAYLTRVKTQEASEAFRQAISLDSAAPLPRLGLGLATIRKGDLEEGRAQIEIAAGLDPRNALIRSYLGKAYFEEKRGPQDEQQFEIAKSLDPNDPTPWFYDAIRKQTLNRPVDALQDLQESMRLNDNRAVYRSRLLLDEDQAVRGVSLARIYDNLGFEQPAMVEGTRSLSIDPTNYSAHRFLSDTYLRLPQHQIAQVSELLQAQLLQPVNVNPVQPRLSIKGLSVVSGVGPGEAAFNEFSPLFERNKPQLTVAGVIGNNDTAGDEAVISGLTGPFSYSIGQFHYQSDGFRENSNVDHNIYNAFTQIAVTNTINLQFEYRYRETSQGDLRQFLNPDINPSDSRDLKHDIYRAGLHISLSPRSDIITSFFYSDRREKYTSVDPVSRTDLADDRDGYNTEAQYLFHEDRFNFLLGGGTYRVNTNIETTTTIEAIPLPPIVFFDKYGFEINGDNLYGYTNIRFPAHLTWTLGLSYETYEDTKTRLDLERVNPKLGMQWDVTDGICFRAAYFENIKRLLAVEQTIEPTQVAGFNQFYDDFNGTRAQLWGVAIDATITDGLYTGLEYTRRDLSEASDSEEKRYRGYLNWAMFSNCSFNAEYRFERDFLSFELETTSVPLEFRYFNPKGLFGQIGTTFVWQEEGSGTAPQDRLKEDFNVVDAAVGYRLPKRLGMLSFEIGNLFDKEFRFRDASYKTADEYNVVQTFVPRRTILTRVVFNY